MLRYADLRKEPRVSLADAVPLDVPLTVYVEPTNRCNLSCEFCPQSLPDYKERAGYWEHIDLDLYRKVINEIAEMGIKSLKLYFFGEPR
jgi:MoaA/NifB/PqqE/SkfB family radical SAM enzyme